ncbi:hypothetical protein GQX73_g5073 [Xylaria multiplex]|uniref:Uncharacterized protein n=1 Tax=Xylaria multiplex TaxID=323545 RepID=A0A7C8MLY7_9PEZI|nr:hypothetical protein GQX73_g5073 [Xylaria multiplex]
MPSQSASNGTNPVQTPNPEPTQPFRDTLVELSAGLAILGEVRCQQKDPSGIMEGALIKKFDRFDLIEKIGISLPMILWAFALIFSPSRNGKHVVASVLREETPKQEPEKCIFTIYLAANNKECWQTLTLAYKKKWENAVNHPTSTPLDFSSDLWQELTHTCIERIKGYMKLAKKQFLGKKGKSTLQEFETRLSSEPSPEFAIKLVSLLKKTKETIVKLEKNLYNESDLRFLVQYCWEITLSENNRKEFEAQYKHLQCDSTPPSPKPGHYKQIERMLDCIQDLAKLPLAFKVFAKLQDILVLNKAWLRIEEISKITENGHIFTTVDDGDYTSLIQNAINNLATKKLGAKRLEDLKALVGTRKTGQLHLIEYATTRTMNSAGVIRADGDAKVHVGDNYSIVHNHLVSNLTERDKAKVRTDFLFRLFTSPYQDRKNRNPKRADGTCEWFTAHRLFQHWQRETSALLWVTADPGCGKSVLARYLVDDVFPPSATRTTCYFFFKDDFDDQRALEGALCCILRQLFIQRPALLSDEILESFREERDQLFASFHKLWDILIRATKTTDHGEIICILDALDECLDQTRLAHALTQHYNKGKRTSTLKFLITSRPYLRIQRGFQTLEELHPTIHLNGESQEEVDKIAQEITISIKQRIEQLCKRLRLSLEEKQILHDELTTIDHRTYLWIYLVFAVIEEAVYFSKSDLRTIIHNLPPTVEEAYNDILRKSRYPDKARKILHIIVAADRPLYLEEMATVIAFQEGFHRRHENLERDLPSLDHLHTAIRETCGLFVVIQDSRVFLLHQTAREFLIQLSPKLLGARSPSLEWQHSFNLQESHRLISEICIRYLLLDDFKRPTATRRPRQPDNISGPEDRRGCIFLNYAASNWADHYRQAHNTDGTDMESLALQLCDTNSAACSSWLEVYGEKRTQEPDLLRELSTSLLITSYFGLDNLVNLVLKENQTNLGIRGALSERTALSWASEKGYSSIVQLLLHRVPKYQVLFRDKLSLRYPTIVNQKDKFGKSPLCYAAANGHRSIVQGLLKRGAKVDSRDENGLTPLLWATGHGHSEVVVLLLENGARQKSNLETRDQHGRTPLLKAAYNGDPGAVKILLDSGAEVNALNTLDRGAEVDASDTSGQTVLIIASARGYDTVVKLLLNSGAEVNALDKSGRTALMIASTYGYDAVVKLLLNSGAEINASDMLGETALMMASRKGYGDVVELLLNSGAEINASDMLGETALMMASGRGYDNMVNLLLDGGAGMGQVFGTTASALSVAALFNNCVDCFGYIQLGRHFGRDYERCQLKVDIAKTRLSRWGEAVAINEDPRFATDNPQDVSSQQARAILEEIEQLFQTLQKASKRYTIGAKQEDLEHLRVEDMQPTARRLHNHLSAVVRRRQKRTSLAKKVAWALYDAKNFEKLVKITEFVDDLEKLFPAKESVRHTLVEVEIEEVNDELSLSTLQKAAADSDGLLTQVVERKLEMQIGKNHAKNIESEESARVRVGNEWAETALSHGLGSPGQSWNEADSITAKGKSAVHIGNNFGGRGIFDV